MNIIEVSKYHQITAFTNHSPNVWKYYPAKFLLADYWVNNFGAPDQSIDYTIIINSFRRDFNVSYFIVESLADCLLQEKSFFWDNDNQLLYVHMEHDQAPYTAVWQYGTFYGYSEDRILYLTDQEYSPALLSSPRVAQQEDIVNSSRLSLMRGTAVLNNMPTNEFKGLNDHFITQKTYGNDVFVYYLPDNKVNQYGDGNRDDLIPVGAFYVEDYDITLKRMPIRLQDKRKAFDVTIPNEFFLELNYPDIDDIDGLVIPLMYGQVRDAKAIPTNKALTSGNVNYRVALLLSSVGTVQVKIDEVWTTKTPINVNLDTGEFSLSAVDGRNSNGGLYDCRVVDPIGIPITYLSDIIKDIENRYLGVEYVDSLYNKTEWEEEEVQLSSGGWVFDSEIKFYDAVALIQGGSTKRFRYEIQPNGKRTIRIDDPDRPVSGTIEPLDIKNRDDIPVTTDSEQVFASINTSYSKSFNSNVFKKTQNSDNKNYVLANYGSSKSLPVNTMLNNLIDADIKALNDSNKFKDIPQIMTLNLMGEQFLNVRIYDTYQIAATPGFVDLDADNSNLLINNKIVDDSKFTTAEYIDNNGAGIYPEYNNFIQNADTFTNMSTVDINQGKITLNIPTGSYENRAFLNLSQSYVEPNSRYSVYFQSSKKLRKIFSQKNGTPFTQGYNYTDTDSIQFDFTQPDYGDSALTNIIFECEGIDLDTNIDVYYTIVPYSYPNIQNWSGSELIQVMSGVNKSISFSLSNWRDIAENFEQSIKFKGAVNILAALTSSGTSLPEDYFYIRIYSSTGYNQTAHQNNPENIITLSKYGDYIHIYENKIFKGSYLTYLNEDLSSIETLTSATSLASFDITQLRTSKNESIGYNEGLIFEENKLITGREYYGITKGQVVGIDPDTNNLTNTVRFKILEE